MSRFTVQTLDGGPVRTIATFRTRGAACRWTAIEVGAGRVGTAWVLDQDLIEWGAPTRVATFGTVARRYSSQRWTVRRGKRLAPPTLRVAEARFRALGRQLEQRLSARVSSTTGALTFANAVVRRDVSEYRVRLHGGGVAPRESWQVRMFGPSIRSAWQRTDCCGASPCFGRAWRQAMDEASHRSSEALFGGHFASRSVAAEANHG